MELQIQNLTKKYGGRTAVNQVSLTLSPGIYGLLGENGAGKTTLMRLICGLQRPTGGRILLDGREIAGLGERYCSLLGYLPQNFLCYGNFSAEDFLLYVAAVKGITSEMAGKRSRGLLQAVGLYGERKRKIRTFSGGMKQRLGIAQAMLNDPHILILDEPTAGLDPKERVRFRNLITSFSRERIVLLSTHIVSDVEAMADTVILMGEGSILHMGRAEEIAAETEKTVWECVVSSARATILADRFAVTGQKNLPDGQVLLRILSESPPVEAAKRAAPTLEDVYFHYFGEMGNNGEWDSIYRDAGRGAGRF